MQQSQDVQQHRFPKPSNKASIQQENGRSTSLGSYHDRFPVAQEQKVEQNLLPSQLRDLHSQTLAPALHSKPQPPELLYYFFRSTFFFPPVPESRSFFSTMKFPDRNLSPPTCKKKKKLYPSYYFLGFFLSTFLPAWKLNF